MNYLINKYLSRSKFTIPKRIQNKLATTNYSEQLKLLYLIKTKLSNQNEWVPKENKEKKIQEKPFMNYGAFAIPHYKKRKQGGEDCHFASDKLLVVIDGVGGWNQVGIDPSEYSRQLCSNIQELFNDNRKIDMKTAKRLLVESAKRVKTKGSSTCTVIVLDEKRQKIYCSYIGDSCYLLLRCKKEGLSTIYKSKEQFHKFNIPYQVGAEGDDPESAMTFSHDIEHNDIIVVGSDGFWDNLEIDMIITLLRRYQDRTGKLNTVEASKALAEKAELLSNDKDYLSPFSKKARENQLNYTGGKPDDITIIVAQLNLKEQNGSKMIRTDNKFNYQLQD